MAQAQAGWYPDPSGDQTRLRWWDGEQWTENYTDKPQEPVLTEAQAGGASQSAQSQDPAQQAYQPVQPATADEATYTMTETDRTLRLIAFILNVVSCCIAAFAVIPLAWMIPMTVHSWGIYKGKKANTVVFGVCTLIFLDLISGILLLVSNKDA